MKGLIARSDELVSVYDDPALRELTAQIVKADEERQRLINDFHAGSSAKRTAFTGDRDGTAVKALEDIDQRRAALQVRWASLLEEARRRVAPRYAAAYEEPFKRAVPVMRAFVAAIGELVALDAAIKGDFPGLDSEAKPIGCYLPPGTICGSGGGLARALADVEMFLRLFDEQQAA